MFVDHSKGDAAEQIWEMSGGDWVQKSVEAVGYPGDPQREPEALYWKAVAAFEISGDRDDLIAVWETLLDRCPDSEWAKKASYVRG